MTEKVLVMLVGDDGELVGNRGEVEFRFLPRIGEHVLLDKLDEEGSEIFEVVDVQYAEHAMMEIWVYCLGDHHDYVVKVPEKLTPRWV